MHDDTKRGEHDVIPQPKAKHSLSHIQGIVFDLDNTLEDFATAEAIAEAHVAEFASQATGCKPTEFLGTFTEIKHRNSHQLEPQAYSRMDWFEQAITKLRLKLGAEELEHEYWKTLRKETKLYPDAIHTLNALKTNGYKLGLLTDSDGVKGLKRRRISELGIDGYFDAIVVTEDVGENKPSLKPFQAVLSQLAIPAIHLVMIGDHPEIDLAPAKKLGMFTVWNQQRIVIDREFPFVDERIKKVSELLGLLNLSGIKHQA